MKMFGEFFRQHMMEIIHFKKNKINLLSNKQQKSCKMQKCAKCLRKHLKINRL